MRQDSGQHVFTLRGSRLKFDSGFETALRGYDRGQVATYVSRVEAALTELAVGQAKAQDRVRELTGLVGQLRADLLAQRRRDAPDQLPAPQRLGARLEQILALAEQEAEQLTQQADKEAEQTRAEAAEVLAKAHRDAEAVLADAQARAQDIVAGARRTADRLDAHCRRVQQEMVAVQDAVARLAADTTAAGAPRPGAGDPGPRPPVVSERASTARSAVPATGVANPKPPQPRRPADSRQDQPVR
jgi:cell division septum initiation protein DivIVA